LKNWTAVGRLHEINVPVLLINGRDDKVTDAAAQPIFFEVPKVRWVTMDKSSHMPFWTLGFVCLMRKSPRFVAWQSQ
jgi:pimeloyl-ACP methyl ester carboxylesterase